MTRTTHWFLGHICICWETRIQKAVWMSGITQCRCEEGIWWFWSHTIKCNHDHSMRHSIYCVSLVPWFNVWLAHLYDLPVASWGWGVLAQVFLTKPSWHGSPWLYPWLGHLEDSLGSWVSSQAWLGTRDIAFPRPLWHTRCTFRLHGQQLFRAQAKAIPCLPMAKIW